MRTARGYITAILIAAARARRMVKEKNDVVATLYEYAVVEKRMAREVLKESGAKELG